MYKSETDIANAFYAIDQVNICESCAYKHSGYAISFSIECGTVVRVWHVQTLFIRVSLGRLEFIYFIYNLHARSLTHSHSAISFNFLSVLMSVFSFSFRVILFFYLNFSAVQFVLCIHRKKKQFWEVCAPCINTLTHRRTSERETKNDK